MYIHFLILLIGFEGVKTVKTPSKRILLVEFIGCIINIDCFFKICKILTY